MAGISAGFASVFGTPLAGAVFGLEVLALGRLRYDALLPCVVAAVVADQVALAWGVAHTHYAVSAVPAVSLGVCWRWRWRVAVWPGGRGFAAGTHALSAFMRQRVSYAPLRPFWGAGAGGLLHVAGACAMPGWVCWSWSRPSPNPCPFGTSWPGRFDGAVHWHRLHRGGHTLFSLAPRWAMHYRRCCINPWA